MKIVKLIDATADKASIGRHAIWLPSQQLKIPFSWGGRLTKYGHDELSYDPGETLPHELAILRALAAKRMAPPIGELVYVETLVSRHPGGWHADPCGAWGYEMADANSLAPGCFDIDAMQRLPIIGSPGAWGDVAKPGNVVNGYLVDVRRSAWDMLRFDGDVTPLPQRPSACDLLARVHRECQFPRGARDRAYQDFWLDGMLHPGQRRVGERAFRMGFLPRDGESVLDIGCQAGGFLQYAAMRGAVTLVGAEIDGAYVDCARALARSCGQNICVRQIDVVAERQVLVAWVKEYFPNGRPDHLLALSMEKHIGEDFLFDLIDEIGARRTYVETNAVSEQRPMKLWTEVQKRGGRYVGDSADRNTRRLYRIERGP